MTTIALSVCLISSSSVDDPAGLAGTPDYLPPPPPHAPPPPHSSEPRRRYTVINSPHADVYSDPVLFWREFPVESVGHSRLQPGSTVSFIRDGETCVWHGDLIFLPLFGGDPCLEIL